MLSKMWKQLARCGDCWGAMSSHMWKLLGPARMRHNCNVWKQFKMILGGCSERTVNSNITNFLSKYYYLMLSQVKRLPIQIHSHASLHKYTSSSPASMEIHGFNHLPAIPDKTVVLEVAKYFADTDGIAAWCTQVWLVSWNHHLESSLVYQLLNTSNHFQKFLLQIGNNMGVTLFCRPDIFNWGVYRNRFARILFQLSWWVGGMVAHWRAVNELMGCRAVSELVSWQVTDELMGGRVLNELMAGHVVSDLLVGRRAGC